MLADYAGHPRDTMGDTSGAPGRPHSTGRAKQAKQFLNTQDKFGAQLHTHDTITTRTRTRNSISLLYFF